MYSQNIIDKKNKKKHEHPTMNHHVSFILGHL